MKITWFLPNDESIITEGAPLPEKNGVVYLRDYRGARGPYDRKKYLVTNLYPVITMGVFAFDCLPPQPRPIAGDHPEKDAADRIQKAIDFVEAQTQGKVSRIDSDNKRFEFSTIEYEVMVAEFSSPNKDREIEA